MVSLRTLALAALAAFGTTSPAMPTVASTELEARQLPGRVVQAGEPVVIDPNGEYIRVSFMNDGSMLGGYMARDGSQSVLKAIRSTDGAASWQPLGEVFRGETALHDMNNAFPLQLPSGRLLFAYRNHDRTGTDLHYTWFRISVSYSDDGGATWHYLSTVAERAPAADGSASGLWEPLLRLAADGALQCYFSQENSAADQDGIMVSSGDGGATWSAWHGMGGTDVLSRDGMIGVAPADGTPGNLVGVFENTIDGRFNVDLMRSHDDGYTWGERVRLYTAAGAAAQSGAPAIYNVWGTLVCSFMTDETVAGTSGYDGAQMKVITSTDGGYTWGAATVTGEAPGHWPGLFNRDPTHFLALYSRDGLGAVSQLYELQV